MSGDPIYTEMIIEYSRNPSNFGKIENPQIHRHDSNPLCGDSIDLYVNTDGTKITEVKFDGKGCAICMACTSVLTEMIQNKNLDEIKNFQKDELLAELGLEHLMWLMLFVFQLQLIISQKLEWIMLEIMKLS